MANGGRIDFTIGYKVDKTGLNDLKNQLNELSKMTPTQALQMNPNLSGINEARSVLASLNYDIAKIGSSFDQAFDSTTGITNITKLNNSLQKLDLSKIQKDFSKLGAQGNKVFNDIAAKAMTTNLRFKETNDILNKMGTTLGNTIKWGISSSLVNTFAGAIQQAYGYVQHLDTSLNDIRIVTGKSADEMERFAEKANKAAQTLGASTTEYTEAALIYYQQGLSDEESQARAETTLKAANVTGQTGREVSEELTAVWNGYKVTAEETELYVDKLAAVAASTASDLEELSTGMSKVASAANAMGVDVDQLNGMLSTIISVTRQAPETAGTALKTIFARIEDLKISGEDEDGVKLGEVSSTLDEVGVHIMDVNGDIRDLGEVIEEVAGKWDTWTDAQQTAIAQAMAGKRQYNNLLALFNNWDMYSDAVETSRNSMGTLQKQQDIYMESTAAHLQQLKTQWEDFYDSIIDTQDINLVIDLLTSGLDKLTNFIDAIGGGKGALLGLGAVATTVFNKQISQGLQNVVSKFSNAKENAKALEAELAIIQQFGAKLGLKSSAIDEIVALKEYTQQYYDVMSQEEIQAKNDLIAHAAEQAKLRQEIEDTAKAYQEYAKGLINSQLANPNNKTFQTEGEKSQATKAKEADPLTGKNVEIVAKAIDNAISSAEKFKVAQENVSEAVEKYKKVLQEESSSQGQVEKAAKNMQKAFEDLDKAQDNYVADANLSEKESDELAESFNKVVDTVKNYVTVYSDATKKTSRGAASGAVNRALEKQKKIIKESTDATIEFGETQKTVGTESAEAYNEFNENLQKIKEAIKATGEFDTRQLISGITGIVSGISSIGFSFQSLSSLTKIWADETTSGVDKVLQTMTSLGMIMPGIISLYNGYKNVMAMINVFSGKQVIINGALFATETAKAAILKINDETLEAVNRELGTNFKLEELASVATDKNTLSLILNTKALKDNKEAQQALGQSQGQVGSGTQGLIKNLPKLGEKFKEIGSNIKGAVTSVGGFVQNTTGIATAAPAAAVGIAALSAAIAVVAVGVGAAIYAYNKWQDELEETALKAQQAAESAKKITEETKEQKNAIEEVVAKYKELNEQYDETNIKQFRQEVYELCKQHNLQSLAVQALSADYKELGKIMEQAQLDINTEYNKDIQNEKEAIQESVKNTTWRDLSHSERDENLQGQQTIDLKGFNGILSKADKELKNNLEKIGAHFIGQGHLTLDSWTKLVTENYKELTKVLNSSASPAAKQLLEIINAQSESLDRYQQLVKEQQNTYTTETYREKAVNITSVQEYDQLRTEMQQDKTIQSFFVDENGVVNQEKVNEFVQSWLNGIDTITTYAQQSDYADILVPKLDLSKEEIEEQLGTLDEETLQFVVSNADLVAATGSVEQFIERYKDIINETNKEQHLLNVGIALTNKDGDELKQEDIDTLFEQKGFEVSLGKTKEEFEAETSEQQTSDLVQYYLKAQQLQTDFHNNKLEDLKEEQTATQTELEGQKEELIKIRDEVLNNDKYKNAGVTEDDLFVGTENLTGIIESSSKDYFMGFSEEDKIEQGYEAIQKFVEGTEELDQVQMQYLQTLQEKYGYDEEDIKLLYYKIQANREYQQALQDSNLPEEIKNTTSYSKAMKILGNRLEQTSKILEHFEEEATPDWSAIKKANEDLKKSTDSTIDNLQGAYSSLTSIMEEYNEMGSLSIDNLQTFLNMDTAYLSALQIENGQMTLNEEALKQIALAKLDEAEAEAYVTAMEELHNEETRQGVEGKQQAVISLQQLGDAAVAAGDAAKGSINDWKAYWDAALNREGVDNDAYAQQVGDALRTKLQAINQVRQQIMNGNFGSTMKGSSKDSTSTKEADHEDYLEREVDLYREINEQLEQIESTLGRIQKENSYKWGKDLQKGLERENKLLDQQLDKLKQKAEIQRNDIAQRRANLEAQGVQFSKDGSSMKNAESVLDKLYAEYNSMVDQYNTMSADQQEEYKKQLEAKKKDIDKTENDLKNYESLFGEYQSILDELQELHYKQIENAVERFNNMVDVHLELDDAKKEWNDFWYEVVQDVDDADFGGKIAQSIGKLKTLVGLGAKAEKSQIGELTTHLNQTTEEVYKQIQSRKRGGEDSIFEEASKLSKENLEKYRDQLMSAVREAKEEVDSIGENYIKQLQQAQELIDKQIEGWNTINDHVEHNIELIKLLSGDKAYDALAKQYDKIYSNNINTLIDQRRSQDYWKGQMDFYTAKLEQLRAANKENTVEFKTYSESLTEATNNYRKAISDLDKTVEKAIQDLQEERKLKDEQMFEELDNALTKGKGLDYVEEEWSLITEISGKYLDNVERALEIEMYANDLEKAANATGLSAANQEKLNKFREEELQKLREKEKLTQYDIDESRARLAIMQAEMALEDQRANKSKMRLRRDSQGNYNYQYVGDQEAEDEAENGILTAKKDWYELVKKRHDELVNYEIANIKKLEEYNQAAAEALANHDTEKYNQYQLLMTKLREEMEQNAIEANKNIQDLTSGTAQFFADVSNANILPTSETTANAIARDASGVKDAVTTAVNSMIAIQNEFDARTQTVLDTAKIDYEKLYSEGIDPTTESLEELVTANETLDVQLTEVNSKLAEQGELLAQAEQGYLNLKDAAVEAISAAEAALEKLAQTTIDTQNKIQAAIAASNAAAQAAASGAPGSATDGTGDGSSNGTDSGVTYEAVKDPNGTPNTHAIRVRGSNNPYLEIIGDDVAGGWSAYFKNKYKGGKFTFKSGGYTGSWNNGSNEDNGRLAVLHQKELVLNESDTSNLLKVITMLRDVVASINIGGLADSLVNSTAQWVNSMSAQSFGNNGISNISNVTNDTNNYKSMVVNADFSGVRSADAIYQALVELENYGMQQNYSTAPHASKSY